MMNRLYKVTPWLFGLGSLAACSEAPIPPAKTPVVEIYQVPAQANQKLRNYPLVVRASELTDLSFRLNGEIVELKATNGMKVKKGDLLAKLESAKLEFTVKERKAKVELSKLQRDRAKKLVMLGSMPESTFDELHAQYEMALADHELAKIQLSYVELKAPFDGIVSTVHTENYQATSIGQPVLTMHRSDIVDLKVDLPDSLLASVDRNKAEKEKTSVPVTLDAYAGHVFNAAYKEHTSEQNEESRSFTLTLQMPIDQDKPAFQGMPGSVVLDLAKIERGEKRFSIVPLEAVVLPDSLPSDSPEKVIWRVNQDNTVESVNVLIKRLADVNSIEVIGALSPGERIVTKGMLYLKDGMRVDVFEQQEVVR